MAHKTLIGGTSYEISGGRTLVNGTAYSIKSGKTLVGGTAYDVGFGKPATVTVSGTVYNGGGSPFGGYYNIDGVDYYGGVVGTSSAGYSNTHDITTASNLTVYVRSTKGGSNSATSSITINGEAIYSGEDESFISYMIPLEDVSKVNIVFSHKSVTNPYAAPSYGTDCTITTVPEGHALVTINQVSYYLGNTYVSIDGVQYQTSATCVVPIGTVIYCYTKAGNKEDPGSVSITLNGQEVSTVTQLGMGSLCGEYYYTVTGMAKIEMTYEEYDQTSVITITEQ